MARRKKQPYGSPGGKYAAVPLSVMDTPAWRAVGLAAQGLFIWLILEWRGPHYNNNGQIILSVRQAAAKMGVSRDTAAKAFRKLQAKGFIKVQKGGSLGCEGHGKCPEYEITSIAMPYRKASKLFLQWSEGKDFNVFKHAVKNPKGKSKSCHSP